MSNLKKTAILIVTICVICLISLNYKLSVILRNSKLQNNIKSLSYGRNNSNKILEFGNSVNRTIIDFVINTPGCYIPNYVKGLLLNESQGITNINVSCGIRAIFIERRPSNKIKFFIDGKKLVKNKNITKPQKIKCCYRFVSRSFMPGREDTQLSYSSCVTFTHGTVTNLNNEVVIVRCVVNIPKSYYKNIIYEDAYIILKKINRKKIIDKPWNVIILGMNSMSRERILNTMPQTAKYLQENKWLDFRGYHKVGWNTYPNIMSLLAGSSQACGIDDIKCNEFMIWNNFKNAGYFTAYGEDHITLSDSLSRNNFKIPPTDHYMRPFFLTGEKRIDNLICMKNIISAKTVLDYAYDFIETYKNDAYFGLFWVNSNGHDNVSLVYDSEISDFFRKLHNKKLLNNTFVIFLSAHGNKYGEIGLPITAYYDERSPMFYMWTPDKFQKSNGTEHQNLQLNQKRLTTPYDIYATLINVLNLFNHSLEANLTHSACPESTSLFEEKSPQRTCSDACIDENWCICHNMTDIIQNESTNRSVQFIVAYIQNRTNSTKTIICMACETLYLDTILRINMYKNEFNNILYVVALKMSPGNLLFEATIMDNGKELLILKESDLFLISPYNRHGYCVINQEDRQYCLCKPTCT